MDAVGVHRLGLGFAHVDLAHAHARHLGQLLRQLDQQAAGQHGAEDGHADRRADLADALKEKIVIWVKSRSAATHPGRLAHVVPNPYTPAIHESLSSLPRLD